MILTVWYILMIALVWSVFYRSALADHTTRFCIRLGLTGTAVGGILGMAAPLYGWMPDAVTVLIVMSIVNMQVAFAQFWKHGVPPQYVQPECRGQRRSSDYGEWV